MNFRKTIIGSLLLIFSLHLSANESSSYDDVMDVFKEQKYKEAYNSSKKFLETYKDSEKFGEVLFIAGRSASLQQNFNIAIDHYQTLIKDFPKNKYVEDSRADLVNCYSGLRLLEDCIRQAKDNLSHFTKSPYADHWNFLIPHCQFRLYQFKEAESGFEKFIKDYPSSQYLAMAKKYKNLINPNWLIGTHNIVSYSGKYKDDVRLQARVASVPTLLDQGYDLLHQRLGVDLKAKTNMIFIFADEGKKRNTLIGQQFLACINNKPTSVIKFFTEKIVVSPEKFKITFIHEMKHSGFKQLMGQSYNDLPSWIKEGLAVYGADQTNMKIQHVLGNIIASGKDPLTALDGVDDKNHNYIDYMEDGMAFEWLESLKKGNVKLFCQRLIKGVHYKKIIAELTDNTYKKAIESANKYCKMKVQKSLGSPYQNFKAIIKEHNNISKKGNLTLKKWADEEGVEAFNTWLRENPESLVVPFARFSLGRLLITCGNHDSGRKILQKVISEDHHRCSLIDASQFYIGLSYNLQKNRAKAMEAFGILMRDFPNSKFKVKGAKAAQSVKTMNTN